MTTLIISQFPWPALGLFIGLLVGGLIFSNQDMLEDIQNDQKAPEEKCRNKSCF